MNHSNHNNTPILWQPTQKSIDASNLYRFKKFVEERHQTTLKNYDDLWEWSVESNDIFWSDFWDFADIIGQKGERKIEPSPVFFKNRFLPDAKLNFAQNLLRKKGNDTAIHFWGEDKVKRILSHDQLYKTTSSLQQFLKTLNLSPKDRVAGLLANTPECLMAMLASASLGLTWAGCSPDFGDQGVIDRFAQIEPHVLFITDGYFYSGKRFNTLSRLPSLLEKIPSIKTVIIMPYDGQNCVEETPQLNTSQKIITLPQIQKDSVPSQDMSFELFPFHHPLYILFSSGTTGLPKCIVHSAGGTLIQHMKEHQLHSDLKKGDLLFYFTTCSWMMWHWQMSALASGVTLLLFDGSPFYPSPNILFDYATQTHMTHFGTSAKYIDSLEKHGLSPIQTHDLSSLKMVLSTGSPLAPESFDYVYKSISKNVCLSSISGGSDIVSCFALGAPSEPVYKGELQKRGLGMAVDVVDDDAKSILCEKGELVCKKPFPSMPLGFWNDESDAKFKSAYFERFDGIWAHGDFAEITSHSGVIIHGRSDAVLNPGGVRIGTAEIYRQVERLDEVVEALTIGQEWDHDIRVVLFVRLRDSVTLTDELKTKIKTQIKQNTTPRHVPAKIIQVVDIPRTKNGKIAELAVRNIVHGIAVKNIESLANPESLKLYQDLTELKEA